MTSKRHAKGGDLRPCGYLTKSHVKDDGNQVQMVGEVTAKHDSSVPSQKMSMHCITTLITSKLVGSPTGKNGGQSWQSGLLNITIDIVVHSIGFSWVKLASESLAFRKVRWHRESRPTRRYSFQLYIRLLAF